MYHYILIFVILLLGYLIFANGNDILKLLTINKKSSTKGAFFINSTGNDLLSHTVTHAVPSALESLTAVFGMGTGVTSPLKSPRKFE